MTNTKFRKRALLSSVAMLLVALVALGSATFAWFAANPNANATGIDLKTTAASGLVIRTDSDSDWSHDAALYKGQTDAFDLQPKSQDQADGNANIFYSVPAIGEKADEYQADSTQKVAKQTVTGWSLSGSNATNNNSEVYAEKVYFKLSDNSADKTGTIKLKGITITPVTGQHLAQAIRVSVADMNHNTLATFATGTISNKTIPTNAGNVLYSTVVTQEKPKVDFAHPLVQNGNLGDKAVTIYNGNLSATDSLDTYCTVYVWLDGEDSECYSKNVTSVDASKFIDSIELNFVLE